MTRIIISAEMGSDFAFDGWEDGILENNNLALLGNNRLKEYRGSVNSSLYQVISHVEKWGCYSFDSVMYDIGYNPEGKAKRCELYKLFNKQEDDLDKVAHIMEFLTGHIWLTQTIRGCCQSEWQEVVFDSSVYSQSAIDDLEACYFGEVYEIGIIEDDTKEVDFSNVDYWDYVSCYHDDKNAICEKLWLIPEETEIFKEEQKQVIVHSFSKVV